MADTHRQIGELGIATGQAAEASTLVSDVQGDIAILVADIHASEGRACHYHQLDSAHFSVTSATFIGEVDGPFGLVTIADGARVEGVAYLRLSGEYIDADPDLIFPAAGTCCGEWAEGIAARPGWAGLTAVLRARVIELDSDVVSRWVPRLLDFAKVVGGPVTSSDGNHG